MEYVNKYASKDAVWSKRTLFLLIIIIIIGFLIFNNVFNKKIEEEEKKPNWIIEISKYLIPVGIFYVLLKKNKTESHPTVETVVEDVANSMYNWKGIHLNTQHTNVRIQQGGVEEIYLEFLIEHITILYKEKIGMIEIYPGETIKDVKRGKQDDEIQRDLAKLGIAEKRHMNRLEMLGLTEEEK